MAVANANVVEHRDDVSRFIVHLTRDDRATFPQGSSARKNLLSILKEQKIRAVRAHCLHLHKVKHLSATIRKGFEVACFTETPLAQLHRLVGKIPGRSIWLESYGVVFRKERLIAAGAEPAIYINSYGGNDRVRQGADAIFDAAVQKKFQGKGWRLLPFVNAMFEKYDFTWEREWRTVGDFDFKARDLVCVVLPETGEDTIRAALNKKGVACVSPGWSYERIVDELASQHRATTKALKAINGMVVPPKKL